VSDRVIGGLLARAPLDSSDSAWPHGAVRDVIEVVKSEALEGGLIIERMNMAGPQWRDPRAGGVRFLPISG
jgi:hypothetical protein